MNEFTFKITYSLQTHLSAYLQGSYMITQKDINSIDRSYFEVLGSNSYCITLRSKNTGHEWHLLYYEYIRRSSFRIYHRHSRYYPSYSWSCCESAVGIGINQKARFIFYKEDSRSQRDSQTEADEEALRGTGTIKKRASPEGLTLKILLLFNLLFLL